MSFSRTLQRLRRNKEKVNKSTFEPPTTTNTPTAPTPAGGSAVKESAAPKQHAVQQLAHPNASVVSLSAPVTRWLRPKTAPTKSALPNDVGEVAYQDTDFTPAPFGSASDGSRTLIDKPQSVPTATPKKAYSPQPIVPALIAASPRSSSLVSPTDQAAVYERASPSKKTITSSQSNTSLSSFNRPTADNIAPTYAPYPPLPPYASPIKTWRYLVIVTSVNSFAQKVITWFEQVGITEYAFHVASTPEAMYEAAERFRADVVICPFLTAIIPASVFTRWITLVVHPGPPGDAGPSSLDWALMGDTGLSSDSASTLSNLMGPDYSANPVQRSHWGNIVFQANEELDGGAVWAWEQYPLPPIGTVTKAQLYQGPHSFSALIALRAALLRVCESVNQQSHNGVDPSDSSTWVKVTPRKTWGTLSVTRQKPFLGGAVHDRPLLQSKSRRPDWAIHTARDVQRIIAAGDSQPGGQLAPLTNNSKTALFAYGCHIHQDPSTVPSHLYSDKYSSYATIPDGTVLAQRDGSVFIKTRQSFGCGAGVWITHGRLPKKNVKEPLAPKVPMVMAIQTSGHGALLEGLRVWEEEDFAERKGTWQAVYVRSVKSDEGIAQLVYWNFYNGAFTTENCQLLVKAMQWATSPARGPVKVLAMMGGNYFSNGIALNTIEASSDAGKETWANINAIDDIVEILLGDVSHEKSPFLAEEVSLTERGIVTVACLRGNAAAGGVAMAAGCDVVVGARGVVLNPAYRAMGLHGSEFHSYSYAKRCGPAVAAHLLKDMTPMSTSDARQKGLIDIEVASFDSTPAEVESAMIDQIRAMLSSQPESTCTGTEATEFSTGPWCRPSTDVTTSLVDRITASKLYNYSSPTRSFPPLVHYRNEELSQMLLDSFHSIRSKRYHSRREAFIRKYKSTATPARYARGLAEKVDEEDLPTFDDAPGWIRGEEWGWAGLPVPQSLKTSEWTRVELYPSEKLASVQEAGDGDGEENGWGARKDSVVSQYTDSTGSSSSQEKLPVTPKTPSRTPARTISTTDHSVELAPPLPPLFADTPAPLTQKVQDDSAIQKKMGMQGFSMPASLGSEQGGKGDVMFGCLYQPEISPSQEAGVEGREVGRAV